MINAKSLQNLSAANFGDLPLEERHKIARRGGLIGVIRRRELAIFRRKLQAMQLREKCEYCLEQAQGWLEERMRYQKEISRLDAENRAFEAKIAAVRSELGLDDPTVKPPRLRLSRKTRRQLRAAGILN